MRPVQDLCRSFLRIILSHDSIYAIMTIAVSGVVPEELALNCTISNFMKMQSDLVRFGIFLKNSKTRHCQHKQVSLYIELLRQNGTRLNDNITKHLDDGIWELRPGNNRIFYFFSCGETFVLLHQFRKKTQKTPKREIERAKSEREDYLDRKGIIK